MTQRQPTQNRAFTFDVDARDPSVQGIPVVVSSDAIVPMDDGPEILVHSRDAIDLERAPLPIIVSHRGGQVNVGVIDNLQIVEGQLRGLATFGTRPEAVGYRDDVIAKIIRSVSVGYRRIKAKLRADGVLVTHRWMPVHAALVAEPADANAGFYRESGATPPAFELEVEPAPVPATAAAAAISSPPQPLELSNMQHKRHILQEQANDGTAGSAGGVASATVPAQARSGPSAMDLEKVRVRSIENLCKANRIDDNIRDHWIGTGLGVEAITEDLLNIVQERGKRNPNVASRIGLTEKETQRFSLFRAINAVAEKDWTKAGFELECTREIGKRLGRNNVEPNRIFVPMEVQERSFPAVGQRDLTVGTTTAGGFLVETKNQSFIEVLRNRTVATRMGARVLSGLDGNVTIPRQTGAATAVWMANEASTLTESQQVFAQLALSPKTVGAYTEVSRQLMLQSSPAAEGIVTSDLAAVCAIAYDLAVISGSGASGQPTGITNTAGIGAVTGTSLAYAGILEFQTDVAGANVMPVAGGYVTTPSVAALLMARVKFSSTASPLWEGNVWDGTMSGFPAMTSLQMGAATMLFGDWSQVIIGEWGTLELEVNPYANFQSAITGIRAIVSMDCGLRYAGAFSLASSIT